MILDRRIPSMLVIAALVLAACGGNGGDTADTSADEPATSSAITTATTSTTSPAAPEPEEVPVSETLDPAGSVDGGNVGPSYLDAAYPTELTGIVGLAIADLAKRLTIDESAVTVVLVQEVVWSDGSLGCPQPDRVYPQVLVDGLRIVLEAGGDLYDYRSGGSSDPELCVQAPDKDETRAGMFELTEDGEIILVPTPAKETGTPTEGVNPPDK